MAISPFTENSAQSGPGHHPGKVPKWLASGYRQLGNRTAVPPCLFVTLPLRPCYPLASQFVLGVNLMRTTLSAILLLVLAATALAQQNSPDSHFDGNSWWAHVKFLADDSLEGRDTGSRACRRERLLSACSFQSIRSRRIEILSRSRNRRQIQISFLR